MRIGEQLLGLAERFDDTRARVEGHLLVGVSEGMLARLRSGIEHLERGIAAYDETPRKVERFETGNDPGVVCHVVEGMLLWMNGFPTGSRPRDRSGAARRAAAPAAQRRLAHFHTGLIHCGSASRERGEHARAVIEISEAHEFPAGRPSGRACRRGLAGSGDSADGLARVEAAIDQYRAPQVAPVFWPSPSISMRACSDSRAGPARASPRRRSARDGRGTARPTDADVGALAAPRPTAARGHGPSRRAAEAESSFERAADRGSAGRDDAPTAVGIGARQLRHAQGRVDEARAVLRPAYDRLTEGFTWPTHRRRAVLDGLEHVHRWQG